MIDREAGSFRSRGHSPRTSLTTNGGRLRAGGSLAPLGIWIAALALAAPAAATQQPTVERLPIKAARVIAFETTEGTMMNVDVSPDGRTVVFDLLGDLYLMPITGGQAKPLTRGLARDLQPVWSPDGRRIAYVSDAGGSLQFWVINADGSRRHAISAGLPEDVVARLEWLPDGKAVVWEDSAYSLSGGTTKIAGLPNPGNRSYQRIETTFSRDGRYLYYNDDGLGTWERTIRGLMRVDRVTGDSLQLARPKFTILRPTV
jgi:hypothetical protein